MTFRLLDFVVPGNHRVNNIKECEGIDKYQDLAREHSRRLGTVTKELQKRVGASFDL